ncbi:hypothetical protein RND71_028496 [Anisodus tanguticus]|uniref:DUF4283 domain-containing protein n=1 Tax=Anisodus tanguticus TaxID=243964 RepID=A0AAE1RJS0_9SOLA|nr:hypothetical protein RND71_028496 [Anisodus tanguticus]
MDTILEKSEQSATYWAWKLDTGQGSVATVTPIPKEGEIRAEHIEEEPEGSNAVQKLTFSVGLQATPPTTEVIRTTPPPATEVVQVNRQIQNGMNLNYFPPAIKDGRIVVKINPHELAFECEKWKNALICHVLRGIPSFKDMLKFVYSIWNFVSAPRVYLQDEGYFIILFNTAEAKSSIMQSGPYTFNNRPMILRNWVKDFKFHPEMLRIIPCGSCSLDCQYIIGRRKIWVGSLVSLENLYVLTN